MGKKAEEHRKWDERLKHIGETDLSDEEAGELLQYMLNAVRTRWNAAVRDMEEDPCHPECLQGIRIFDPAVQQLLNDAEKYYVVEARRTAFEEVRNSLASLYLSLAILMMGCNNLDILNAILMALTSTVSEATNGVLRATSCDKKRHQNTN